MLEYTTSGVIERKLQEIQEYIYEAKIELPVWRTKTGVYEDFGTYNRQREDGVIQVGEHWVCSDHVTRWFYHTMPMPASHVGKKTVLLLETGGEGIVRINGKIQSAITSYIQPGAATRTRVNLPQSFQKGDQLEIEIEASLNYMEFSEYRNAGKKEIEYTFREAKITLVNELAESYYFDLKTAYQAMLVLENPLKAIENTALYLGEQQTKTEKILKLEDPYLFNRVRDAILKSVTALDFDFSRQAFLESLVHAKKILETEIAAIPHMPHTLVKFVGQGHIDTAWLWTLRETARKTAKTFSNVFALMEQYPEFIFAFSQPQLFQYIKEYYPELYEQAKEKVKSGQLELVGNTWVEMDTNIPSGESLVRQILYGRQFFIEEFGICSNVFWMPDVFGYSWALPQIIKRSGMNYFYTSKLNNNKSTRFPHTLFQWKGIDGTTVLSYLQRLNYNGDFCPQTIDTLYRRFDEKDNSDELLMTFGYGDGGGGPSYEMLEAGKRLKAFPGLQKTEIATAQSFYEDVAPHMDDLPEWNDEMYFEHHRGTYTSQARVKRSNRKNELLYRDTEILCSIADNLWGCVYPYETLKAGYKMLLTNQFHDILPGSSIASVYRQAEAEYEKIKRIAQVQHHEGMQCWEENISHEKGDLIVVNTLPFQTSGMVLAESGSQSIHFWAEAIPPMGYKVFSEKEYSVSASSSCEKIIREREYMENDYFQIRLDQNGNITSIWDKEKDREVLVSGKVSNMLRVFEDKPANETAWNIELEYQNKSWDLTELISSEVIENNENLGVLRQVRRFHRSEVVQDIVVYRHSRRIDFKTTVNWMEREKMLKVEFHPDVHTRKAVYEIQFGAIERPNHWNTKKDKAKFEVCAHKWADLSEGGYGVSLLNDCKYGYDIKGKCMRLTLLRSTIDPDAAADQGGHEFTYALYPHAHAWQDGNVVQSGYELNSPLEGIICKERVQKNKYCQEKSFLWVDSDNLVIDTLKKAEDQNGWIVRIFESTGKKTKTRLHSGLRLARICECNLMEEPEMGYEWEQQQASISFEPYEIKTFRIMQA